MSIASPALLNPLGIISAIVSTVEAGLYSNVEAGEPKDEGKVARWIRHTSISRFPIVQRVLSVANAILFLAPAYILTEKLFTHMRLAPIYPPMDNFIYLLGWSSIALVGTVALSAFILNRVSRLNKRKVGEVKISASHTKTQLAAKVILMGKIAAAIAASFLVTNPFWYGLTAVSTSYSLWKNYRIKWLNVTRDPHPIHIVQPSENVRWPFIQQDRIDIRKVVTTYRMLQIPSAAPAIQKDNCGICHKQLPDVSSCAKHVFHQKCLERAVGDETRSLLEDARFNKFRVTHTRNGAYSGTSYKYDVNLLKRNMPACFVCRDVPAQNKCFITVHDRNNGVIKADVTVRN